MLVHIDNVKYKCKPSKMEIGGIKKRFTKSESVKDVTAEQLAKHLTCGRTVQPGVTPFSEKSRLEGKKGRLIGQIVKTVYCFRRSLYCSVAVSTRENSRSCM